MKFLLNCGLIKIALSDSEKKPQAVYIPLCKSNLDQNMLQTDLTLDCLASGHDTYELAASCAGRRGAVGSIDLKDPFIVTDWQVFT